MKIRTKLVPVALAKPGMKLAAQVEDSAGRILLIAGAELTEKSLASLLKRNICCVVILEQDARSEEELACERSQATAHLDALFQSAAHGTNRELLRQLILEYRLEALS